MVSVWTALSSLSHVLVNTSFLPLSTGVSLTNCAVSADQRSRLSQVSNRDSVDSV